MQGYDPGSQRMAADAQAAGGPSPTGDAPVSPANDARLAKLRVEVHHINPPAGARLQVTSDSPGYIDVDPPRTMGAMPDSGQQRDVAKNGY